MLCWKRKSFLEIFDSIRNFGEPFCTRIERILSSSCLNVDLEQSFKTHSVKVSIRFILRCFGPKEFQ